MLKRHKWLMGIIVFAFVSIIALHAYFNYLDFKIKTYEFQQQVNLSFEEAVAQEKKVRIDSFINYTRALFEDTSKVEILAKYNEEHKRTQFSMRDKYSDDEYTTLSFEYDKRVLNHLDSINYQITLDHLMNSIRETVESGILYYWTQTAGKEMQFFIDSTFYDQDVLAEFFQENLTTRSIHSSFHIERVDSNFIAFDAPRSNEYKTPVFATEFPGRKSVNVAAVIYAPIKEIFGRTKVSIIGSCFNILLIAASFFILLRLVFKLNKLSRIKDDFIDNITHELQTPIATLMAANEAMRKYKALENHKKRQQYLDVSKVELERLSKMVDNILIRSVHNREELNILVESVNIQELIRNVVEKQGLMSRNVQFLYDFKADGIKIKTDRMHLQNVLENLIENSIKYNESDPKTIEVKTSIYHDRYQINIKDNGIGIKVDEKERVFEKFYRNPKVEHTVKGFGIGLYYVKSIIQRLNGNISIDSKTNKGTSIFMTLPLNNNEI